MKQPKNNNKRTIRTIQPSQPIQQPTQQPIIDLPNEDINKKENNEVDERRVARRKREAEAKKRRRLNETQEQRQHRLALHAERMRKSRQANKLVE